MHEEFRRRYDVNHDRVRDTGSTGSGDYTQKLMADLEQAKRLRLRTRTGGKR
jgi:hypothetical protein